MKSAEEAAGEDCAIMHRRFAGTDWTRMLPAHISAMLGNNHYGVPLWRRRAMEPDGKIFELDSFEDYLMKPFRYGLGLKSWWAIDCALKTQGKVGREAIAMIENEIGSERYRENVRISQQQIESQGKAAAPAIRAGPGRGNKTVSDAHRLPKGAHTTGRLIGRLKRDHPDILAGYERGEFKSAAAAARAAGIKVGPTPLQSLRRFWKAASDEERAMFLDEALPPIQKLGG